MYKNEIIFYEFVENTNSHFISYFESVAHITAHKNDYVILRDYSGFCFVCLSVDSTKSKSYYQIGDNKEKHYVIIMRCGTTDKEFKEAFEEVQNNPEKYNPNKIHTIQETQKILNVLENFLFPENYCSPNSYVTLENELNSIGYKYTELNKILDNVFLISLRKLERNLNYTDNVREIIALLENYFQPPTENLSKDETNELKEMLIDRYKEIKNSINNLYRTKSIKLLETLNTNNQ